MSKMELPQLQHCPSCNRSVRSCEHLDPITKSDKIYQPQKDTYISERDDTRFCIMVKCDNCKEHKPILVKKGTRINAGTLKKIKCVACEVSGFLKQVEWDGHKYV